MTETAANRNGKPPIDWQDPDVPVGNSPKLPRWPLVLAASAWVGWLVFLAAMALS